MQRYFDIAEQESIRNVLLLYARMHGIGVPRLSWRIVADHPLKMNLPVKTLARFLAGKRVNDAALAACYGFAIKIADPLSPLGAVLHAAQENGLFLAS